MVKSLREQNPGKKIWILGELIHNSHVTNELERLGIFTVNDLSECSGDGIVVIRTHGEPPNVIEEAKNRGFETVDLTCPDVKKVQQKASELVKEGYLTIIAGKSEHPEVMAIKANARMFGQNVFVVSSVNDIYELKDLIKQNGKVGLVVQTTQKEETFKEIINALAGMVKELKIYNTICRSTGLRQSEAQKLAGQADLVIVAGDKHSSNTNNLAGITSKITKTVLVSDESELEQYKKIIDAAGVVAVTAGASTPDNIIKNVIHKVEEYKNERTCKK